MRRRPTVLAAVLGAVTLVLRRRSKARDAERELWKVATSTPHSNEKS